MTELLEKAISKIKTLPSDQQEAIASIILEEIQVNQEWNQFSLVSRIFRAGSKIKNWALLYKGFRKPKSGALINKDTNQFSLEQAMRDLENNNLPEYTETDLIEKWQ